MGLTTCEARAGWLTPWVCKWLRPTTMSRGRRGAPGMAPIRTLHPWNSLCLGAQVVQVNTEWDSTLARRRYRGERRQIDGHIGCARAALHERPFCAHPNACDTQTHSLSAAPPLSGFTCLPAFALVCPLASGCDHLLQYFCFRACPSAPLNIDCLLCLKKKLYNHIKGCKMRVFKR